MSESYDISKCDGWINSKKDINGKPLLCENRDNCLRYTKKADDLLQSWLIPEMKENGNCRNYIYNYKNEKPTKIGSIVLEYLNRNTKHDVVPAGYYSRSQIIKLTGFTPKRFFNFMQMAKRMKAVECKSLRVAKGSRCGRTMCYKFSPELCKLMGLASR